MSLEESKLLTVETVNKLMDSSYRGIFRGQFYNKNGHGMTAFRRQTPNIAEQHNILPETPSMAFLTIWEMFMKF